MARTTRLLAALTLLLLLGARAVQAQEALQGIDRETPALISADSLSYDEALGVVTASGNVEISQNDRVLLADTVTYNQRTDVVRASGNVSLLEPTGEVLFADYAEVTSDLREGFIRDIRLLLTDRSRLAAASGLRTGDRHTILRKGVFSPCELCREDPERAPLWQIKAVEVEHDQEAKVIRYRDAWMEMFGVPVAYTPYFEHPDPTVERKSGFLAPTFGSSEILGLSYQQPYYWSIGRNVDATIAPFLTTKQGAGLAGEYRHLFTNGNVLLRGSGTVGDRTDEDGTIDENRFRGHIDSVVRFDIDETWRWGVDAQRATDDTYLRVYNFSSEAFLTSHAFVEGLRGRNYAAVNAYTFQDLRAGVDDSESPFVLPLAEFNYVSEPGLAGSHFFANADVLALWRTDGRDSRRIGTTVGWEAPYTTPQGLVFNLTAQVQADGYLVNQVDPTSDLPNPDGPTVSEFTGRVFPQLALGVRYPWVQTGGRISQVIEPIAQAVFSPNGSNPGEIPNEDSIDFEFDDTNLFSLNRFPGRDRVDSGTRFDYGLEWTATGVDGGYASAFVGQSYRLSKSDVFAPGSGLSDHFSDIVGRVEVKPLEAVDLSYRFRLDKDTFEPRRNEVDLVAGPPALNLTLSYLSIDDEPPTDDFGKREEINWTLRSRVSQYWSLFGGQRFDFDADEVRQIRVGANYRDECFLIEAVAERNFFRDREIAPEDAFFVRIVFKHLGGFSTADSSGGFGS